MPKYLNKTGMEFGLQVDHFNTIKINRGQVELTENIAKKYPQYFAEVEDAKVVEEKPEKIESNEDKEPVKDEAPTEPETKTEDDSKDSEGEENTEEPVKEEKTTTKKSGRKKSTKNGDK
jgi:hypothetical protein